MNVEILKKSTEKEWVDYVANHSDSTIYHTLEWKKVLEETYDTLKPLYLIIRNSEDEIEGILPLFMINSRLFGNRVESLPLSHICGPLCSNDNAFYEIMRYAIELTQKENNDFLEIRLMNQLNSEMVNTLNLQVLSDYLTVIVPLSDDSDKIWENMSKARRKSVNRAKREGVDVYEGTKLNDLKKHYNILLEVRKKQGVPPYGFDFFKNMHKYLFSNDYAKLYLAEQHNTVLFALIVFIYRKTITAGYGMPTREKKYSKLHASELTYWTVFEWACDNIYSEFDFGRCHKAQNSLIDYKMRWGGTKKCTPYYYFLLKKNRVPGIHHMSPKFKLAKLTWQKLPIDLGEYIGPKILKHII